MAIIDENRLTKALGVRRVDKRFESWLWLFLNYHRAGLSPDHFDSSIARDDMAEFISINPDLKNHIKFEKNKALVPDENLKWITQSERQCDWLMRQLDAATGPFLSTFPQRLQGRDRIVARIDWWNESIDRKVRKLDNLKFDWGQYTQQDYIFNWFKGEDERAKCELAWEWMNKHKPTLIKYQTPFKQYDEVIIYFDRSEFKEEEKAFYVDKIKRRWSQQRYRENLSGKKQYNFILSDSAIQALDKIAIKHDLKRPQILEILIKMEAEHGKYVPEKLRQIGLIDSI
ncbi:hypothetical protein OL229_08200 [Neisseriaceae bacterium JH1-16]|nr:hypothetical protein [Neisseriaceae bacterium JH1-16]